MLLFRILPSAQPDSGCVLLKTFPLTTTTTTTAPTFTSPLPAKGCAPPRPSACFQAPARSSECQGSAKQQHYFHEKKSKVRGGGLNPGSTQVRTLGLDQRGGRPNINIKNLGSTQVQPRFNPGSTQVQPRFNPGLTQFEPRFNPGSTQVRTQVRTQVQPRFEPRFEPRFNPGSTQVQPRFNPGSTQVQLRFNPG